MEILVEGNWLECQDMLINLAVKVVEMEELLQMNEWWGWLAGNGGSCPGMSVPSSVGSWNGGGLGSGMERGRCQKFWCG